MTGDCGTRGRNIRRGDVQQLARRRDAGPGDVQKDADPVRRGLRNLHQRVDVVGAGRPAVDHRGDAVAQQRRRRQVRCANVHMEVDQPGSDQLPARIDDVARVAMVDVRLNGDDAVAVDGDVRFAIQPLTRIENPPTLDDQLVLRRRPLGRARERRNAGGGEKRPSGQHTRIVARRRASPPEVRSQK